MIAKHLLRGERACLTSKHEKLRAVRKPFLKLLSCDVCEVSTIDTDLLGTFSGEVERVGRPSEVVVKKARMGAKLQGLRFGLATEGSFGPDPRIPLMPSHLELIAIVDLEKSTSIMESEFSNRTNLSHLDVSDDAALKALPESMKFPSHALIVRPLEPKPGIETPIFKGIRTMDQLQEAVFQSLRHSQIQTARIETDMRAHMNPSRELIIRKAARKLARRLEVTCKDCHYPGWGLVRQEPGLECEECEMPGRWIKNVVHGCVLCEKEETVPRSDGRTSMPAEFCDICNP